MPIMDKKTKIICGKLQKNMKKKCVDSQKN